MQQNRELSGASGLRIAAVSRITKIPVDTLRAWERRYGVVKPVRSETSARLYAEEDVLRLKLIKALVDRGHGIGSIAALPRSELEEQLRLHEATETVPAARELPSSLLVHGRFLPEQVAAADIDTGLWLVLGAHLDWNEFAAAAKTSRPDALVMEVGVLVPQVVTDIARLVSQCRPATALLIYTYASSELLEQLTEQNIALMEGPSVVTQWLSTLDKQLDAAVGPPRGEPTAESNSPTTADRRFSDRTLARLSQVRSDVKCECPRHLAELVMRLTHFEAYSAACRNLNREDAAMHAKLARVTAGARAALESSLQEVIELEGLSLGPNELDWA